MAEPGKVGNIPVQELKEVQDLTKLVNQTIGQVDKKFESITDSVKSVSDELSKSLDKQVNSNKRAQDLAKHYQTVLNFVNKQNLSSKIGLGISTLLLKFKKNITDEEKEQIDALNNQTKGISLVSTYAKKIKDSLQEGGGATDTLNKGFLLGGTLFAVLVGLATKFGGMIDSIGQSFGSLSVMGEPFKNDLLDASVEATKLGGGIQDVAAITSTLASNFGMNVDEAAKLSSKVFDTSKALGLSGDEAANLFGTLMQTANLSDTQAEKLAEGAFQLARQAGVAPTTVLRDIAGSAEEIALFTKDGGDNIAEAAVQARQMGISLSTTAKIAEGLLDFENSIAGEVEASVLIGKQLNFQKARELSLAGDIAGATKNIVDQLGSEAEFNELNLIQRQSLAKSIGVSVSELSKLVSGTEKLTLAGSLAAGSFDDLTGQEALSNLSSITNEFKSLLSEALVKIGPEIEILIGKARDFIKESGGVSFLKDTFMSIVSVIGKLITNLPTLISLFVGLKTAAISLAIAQSAATLTKAGALSGPVGITVALAGLLAGFVATKTMLSGFQDSGIINGKGSGKSPGVKDTVVMAASPGELLLNEAHQANLASKLNTSQPQDMSETNELLRGILGSTSAPRTVVRNDQIDQIAYNGSIGGTLVDYG